MQRLGYLGDWAAGQRGLASITQSEDFRSTICKAIEYCKVLDCPRIHVMAGRINQEEHHNAKELYFGNIILACKLCQEHGLQVFVEPICRAAIDGYFLNSYEQVEEMIKKGIKVALLLVC